MEQVCLVLPLLESQEATTRRFLEELDTERTAEYRASQERLGITKEMWFLAGSNGSSTLIAYIEADAFEAAVGTMAGSQDPFDAWFKERLASCTGLDLNDPPPLVLPELLATYVR